MAGGAGCLVELTDRGRGGNEMEGPPWPGITPGPGMRGCLVRLLPRTDPELLR